MSKNETYYIVQYNDCYGNGNDKKIEALLSNEKDFKQWLKKHNKERKDNGEMTENPEEFTLIPITLFN